MVRWGGTVLLALTLAFAASSAATAQAPQPSFDCGTARSPIDRMICADYQLASQDRQLAEVYSSARTQSTNPQQLIANQRAWIATRNACGDSRCISNAYSQRISELERLVASSSPASSSRLATALERMNDALGRVDTDGGKQATNSIAAGLSSLAGTYAAGSAVGKPASCDKNDFTLSFNGDQLTFTERNGKRHVERILNFAGYELETQVVASPDVPTGTLYRYTIVDDNSVGIRNLSTGAEFALARCATSTAQGAPSSQQNTALTRQQAEAAERERQAEAQRAADDAARRIAALEAQQRATLEAQQRAQAAERERQAAVERERQAVAQRVAEEARQREQAAELERQAAAKREADLQAQVVAAQQVAEEQRHMLMVGGGVAVALIVLAFGVAASIRRKRAGAKPAVVQSYSASQPTRAPAMASTMATDEKRLQSPPQPPPEPPPLSVAEAASRFASDPEAPSVKIIDEADALLSDQMQQLVSALKVGSVQLRGSNAVTAAQATSLSRLPKFTRRADATLAIEDTATNFLAADNGAGIRMASESILVGTNTVSADQAQQLTMIPRFRVRADAILELSDTAAAILSPSNAQGIKLATRVFLKNDSKIDLKQGMTLTQLPSIARGNGATLILVGNSTEMLLPQHAAILRLATGVLLTNGHSLPPSDAAIIYRIPELTVEHMDSSENTTISTDSNRAISPSAGNATSLITPSHQEDSRFFINSLRFLFGSFWRICISVPLIIACIGIFVGESKKDRIDSAHNGLSGNCYTTYSGQLFVPDVQICFNKGATQWIAKRRSSQNEAWRQHDGGALNISISEQYGYIFLDGGLEKYGDSRKGRRLTYNSSKDQIEGEGSTIFHNSKYAR